MKKLCLIILIFIGAQSAFAQNEFNLDEIINSKKFIFQARSAYPQNSYDIAEILRKIPGSVSSSKIDLDPNIYNVKFNSNEINAYLPYYGRSFSGNNDLNEGGNKFISNKFSENIKKNKKGVYHINYQIKDVFSTREIILEIQPNGNTILFINSMNRESISYDGIIKAIKD